MAGRLCGKHARVCFLQKDRYESIESAANGLQWVSSAPATAHIENLKGLPLGGIYLRVPFLVEAQGVGR
jgi:hypothetical protein